MLSYYHDAVVAVGCLYADIYIMASNFQVLLNCRSQYISSYHAHYNHLGC